MTPRTANLIPNEVLSDISDFVKNYNVPGFTLLSTSFAAAFGPRLRRINEDRYNLAMAQTPFFCAECLKDLNESDVRDHISTKHINNLPYKCIGCNYETLTANDISQHASTVHQGNDLLLLRCLFLSREEELNVAIEKCRRPSAGPSSLIGSKEATFQFPGQSSQAIIERLSQYTFFFRRHDDRFAEGQEPYKMAAVTVVNQHYCVTAWHCIPTNCGPATQFSIFHHTDGRELRVKLLLKDKELDFALMACITPGGFESYPPGVASPERLQKIYCAGYPRPLGSDSNPYIPNRFTVIPNSVMHVDCKPVGKEKHIYSRIVPGLFGGNSGGGIFLDSGTLLGINISGKELPQESLESIQSKTVLEHCSEPSYSQILPINRIMEFAQDAIKEYESPLTSVNAGI